MELFRHIFSVDFLTNSVNYLVSFDRGSIAQFLIWLFAIALLLMALHAAITYLSEEGTRGGNGESAVRERKRGIRKRGRNYGYDIRQRR